jgi:hypothetical protein
MGVAVGAGVRVGVPVGGSVGKGEAVDVGGIADVDDEAGEAGLGPHADATTASRMSIEQ